MEQKKISVTFPKVTALLCALALLAGLIAFFSSSATKTIAYLNQSLAAQKDSITDNENRISQLQADIVTYQQDKQTAEAALATAEEDLTAANAQAATAQNQLNQAETALDAVCWRAYYSSWSCTETCRPLHTEVSNKTTALNSANDLVDTCENAVSSTQSRITSIDNDIAQAEQDIKDAESRIQQLKADISKIRSQLAGAWAILILRILAMILAVGGLGLFVKSFYTETVDKFTLYACGGLAASSLLFFISGAINNTVWENAPLLYILASPHTWNIVVMALLGTVLLKKTEKPVMFRNIAVVAAVIMLLLAIISLNVPCMLYAVAMICTAFVIVPLVFTQYISIAKHIFLSLITFGIWQLVWTYHVTKNLNEVPGAEIRRPAIELLLCMFLPFFYPYWLYKTAESVEVYGKENGKAFRIDIVCIAFAFVCPLFATVLIQNKINVIAGKPE